MVHKSLQIRLLSSFKRIYQNPEMLKLFCSISTESFTLLVHLIGPHVRKNLNCCFGRGKAINYSQARKIYSLVTKSLQMHKKNIPISQNNLFKHPASFTNANYT